MEAARLEGPIVNGTTRNTQYTFTADDCHARRESGTTLSGQRKRPCNTSNVRSTTYCSSPDDRLSVRKAVIRGRYLEDTFFHLSVFQPPVASDGHIWSPLHERIQPLLSIHLKDLTWSISLIVCLMPRAVLSERVSNATGMAQRLGPPSLALSPPYDQLRI